MPRYLFISPIKWKHELILIYYVVHEIPKLSAIREQHDVAITYIFDKSILCLFGIPHKRLPGMTTSLLLLTIYFIRLIDDCDWNKVYWLTDSILVHSKVAKYSIMLAQNRIIQQQSEKTSWNIALSYNSGQNLAKTISPALYKRSN